MAVLHPGKFLYLCTPHTASESTSRALQEIEGSLLLEHKHVQMVQIQKGMFRKVSVRRGSGFEVLYERRKEGATYMLGPDLLTGREVVMSAIRNPYDMVATWWQLDRRGFQTLADFVSGQTDPRFSELDYLVKQSSRVLTYERLQSDLDAVLQDVGMEPVLLPKLNVTPGKRPWREYFDSDAIEAVNERFGHLFEQYGYERV